MSHTQTRKASLSIEGAGLDALKVACEALGHEYLGNKTHALYEGKVTGHGVKLKGWSYPVVFTENDIKYDNYNGRWGKQEVLDKLLQKISSERIKIGARQQGYSVIETEEEGEIKLVMEVH